MISVYYVYTAVNASTELLRPAHNVCVLTILTVSEKVHFCVDACSRDLHSSASERDSDATIQFTVHCNSGFVVRQHTG